MKNFMVRADKECFEWISSTLRAEIEKKTQFEASSQSEDLSPTTPEFSFSKALTGIRGKVSWSNQDLHWKLDYINNQSIVLADYLEEKGVTLSVNRGMCKADFGDAGTNTFLSACQVWNSVDTSKRPRLKLPAYTACETLRIPPQDGCERAYAVSYTHLTLPTIYSV